jgi:hypothetical protein
VVLQEALESEQRDGRVANVTSEAARAATATVTALAAWKARKAVSWSDAPETALSLPQVRGIECYSSALMEFLEDPSAAPCKAATT